MFTTEVIKSLSSTKLYSKSLRQALESKVMTDPEWAYWYARDVMKQRWPEAEPTIRTDPYWAYRYALDVMETRWPEAGPMIRTDPEWAYWYALNVMKLNETQARKWSKENYPAVKENVYKAVPIGV